MATCSRAATTAPSWRRRSGRSWRDDGNQAEAAAVSEAAATAGRATAIVLTNIILAAISSKIVKEVRRRSRGQTDDGADDKAF